MGTSNKSITFFRLGMINLAAILAIRNWPFIAEYGFSSVFFFLLAALLFFIPLSLVSAELATTWPQIGGIFVWIKNAFGHRLGFLSIWMLWIQTAIWYPTVLSFIASTLAYAFDPALASNKIFIVSIMLILFWGFTFANLLGMEISSWISTIGFLFGTFIPALLTIILGSLWYADRAPINITLSWDSFFPDMSSINQLVYFAGVMFSLAGMEMSSIHAKDVENPQKNYPKAIGFSMILILVLSILGVLSIAMVLPKNQISLVAGSMQAFEIFLSSFHLKPLVPLIAILVVIGASGGLSTWIAGPSKGLLAAAQSGDLPPSYRKINKNGMPTSLLVLQGIIVSIISLLFIFMPSVNSAFWFLTAIVSQLYFIMYIILFTAAIYLRYKMKEVPRPFKVPGNNLGMWIVGSVGILSSLFTIFIGFYPPAGLPVNNVPLYVFSLIIGIGISCLIPSFILLFQKPSWKKPLDHEKR